MGATKHYLNNVICACSDEKFGQDAVEYAIVMGHIHLTMDFERDVATIMSQYDEIADHYQREVNRNEALLLESYGPLFTEFGRHA